MTPAPVSAMASARAFASLRQRRLGEQLQSTTHLALSIGEFLGKFLCGRAQLG